MSVLAHKWVSSGALKGQAAFAKARVVVSSRIMGSEQLDDARGNSSANPNTSPPH